MLRNLFFTGWKLWLGEQVRAVAGVLVFAAVVALMLVFEGLRFGIIEDLRAFPTALPADFVVVEKDIGQFAVMASNLPQISRQQVEAVSGVESVEPLALAPVIFTWNGLKTPALILAYDRELFPKQLFSGRRVQNPHEAVIDSALAKRHQLKLGDMIEILDYELSIVGISSGTTSPFAPYVFLYYDDLIDLALEADMSIGADDYSLVSVLLVKSVAGTDLQRLRAEIEAAVPEGDIYRPPELGARDAEFGWRLLGPVLLLTTSTAWLIGILVMGFLRYAEVQARLQEYGVQKALGADTLFLAGVMAVGALALVLFAFPLGFGLASGLAVLIQDWNPLYSVMLTQPKVIAGALLAVVSAAIVGSLIPLNRLRRLDPTLVFQR